MEFSVAPLSTGHWVFLVGAVFLIAVVRGFTGFGFSALSVATLTFIMPPAVVVPLVMMMEIAASAWLLPGVWRQVDGKWLPPTLLGVAVGTPVGVYLLAHLPATTAQLAVYGLLTVFTAAHIVHGNREKALFAAPPVVAGVIAGAANGLAAIAGMVLALFLLTSARPAAVIRASLIALFFIGDLYALLWSGGFGLLKPVHAGMLAVCLAPLLIGTIIGGRLFARSGGRHYHRLAMGLIIGVTAMGLARLLLEKILTS